MSVARVTEITSTSAQGFEDAIQKGIERAQLADDGGLALRSGRPS
jgi:flavin-binding protein dodecin